LTAQPKEYARDFVKENYPDQAGRSRATAGDPAQSSQAGSPARASAHSSMASYYIADMGINAEGGSERNRRPPSNRRDAGHCIDAIGSAGRTGPTSPPSTRCSEVVPRHQRSALRHLRGDRRGDIQRINDREEGSYLDWKGVLAILAACGRHPLPATWTIDYDPPSREQRPSGTRRLRC
jgi:hypothetical protein